MFLLNPIQIPEFKKIKVIEGPLKLVELGCNLL